MTVATETTYNVLYLCTILTITWGIYFGHAIHEWVRPRKAPISRRGERVIAARKIVVAFAAVSLPVAFLFRSISVIAGYGDEWWSSTGLFVCTGINLAGSVLVDMSLWWDD